MAMTKQDAAQNRDYHAFIEDRLLHGEHVIINSPITTTYQLVHPGCATPTECELSGRAIAPNSYGVFVPVIDDDGRIAKPEHGSWDALIQDGAV